MFVLEVIYASAIFFSNSINLFPIYESLYKLKPIDKIVKNSTPKKAYLVKLGLRISVIIVCFGVCFLVPDFIDFISFVGSFLFAIIGLYIPVILLGST